MIPGPDHIYQCPDCGNLLAKGSLVSGNTFHSSLYSDAKLIAPMLPDFPDLTQCRRCGSIFWLSKMKKIGTIERGSPKHSDWQNADRADFLSVSDLFNALRQGLFDNPGEELLIRMWIWWTYNARFRNEQKMFGDESDEAMWQENCLALMKLLDFDDDSHKIMLAELNRNLGNFEDCVSIINSIEIGDLEWIKEKFRHECEMKNKWVFKLR